MAVNCRGFQSVFTDRALDGVVIIVIMTSTIMTSMIMAMMMIMSKCLVILAIMRDRSQQLTVTSSPCSLTVLWTRMRSASRNKLMCHQFEFWVPLLESVNYFHNGQIKPFSDRTLDKNAEH